jgi:TetR/AcrR family transcriptional regulator
MVSTTPNLDTRLTGSRSEMATSPRSKILAAGHLLIVAKGASFTTQEVVREAGVALQTFYRYFGSKDQLLLALIGQLIREHCVVLAETARPLDDPVARLEMYVRMTLAPLHIPEGLASARFITAEHWRLHQTCPTELSAATQPVSDLLRDELEAGLSAGTLFPRNPERDAWLMTKTVIGAYHHYAFQPDDPALATLDDDVWSFCLAAAGGTGPD